MEFRERGADGNGNSGDERPDDGAGGVVRQCVDADRHTENARAGTEDVRDEVHDTDKLAEDGAANVVFLLSALLFFFSSDGQLTGHVGDGVAAGVTVSESTEHHCGV